MMNNQKAPALPFSPDRWLVHRLWVGLKGATGSGKTADVSTAGANSVSDEERNEALDRSQSGLSGSSKQ